MLSLGLLSIISTAYLISSPIIIYSLDDPESRCIAERLSKSVEELPTIPRLIEICLREDCLESPDFDVEIESVVPVLFNFVGTGHKDASNVSQVLQDLVQTTCPKFNSHYDCVLKTLQLSDMILRNGTEVPLDKFKNDLMLALFYVPMKAFCDAEQKDKDFFYDFLNEGGFNCITNQKKFLNEAVKCIERDTGKSFLTRGPQESVTSMSARRFVETMEKCTPSLIRDCENGDRLESMYNQTVLKQLFLTLDNTWLQI